ncbi:MAG: glutaredoxin [Deltaproteobacteria bacterium]|nr:MAG: glutaredoxin [Deltaproteobacteria bacterium]
MPTPPPVTDHVRTKQDDYHSAYVDEVAAAVAKHPVVVVGMSVNPHVKRARQALDAAGIAHHYIGYGGYHNLWRERLALKLWTRWPTFPQVFVNGTFIGGANETQHMLNSGELQKLLDS